MSSDNYYVVRKHPKGGYAAVMGFASDNRTPPVRVDLDQQFETVEAAFDFACGEYSEYGVSVHAECGVKQVITWEPVDE